MRHGDVACGGGRRFIKSVLGVISIGVAGTGIPINIDVLEIAL